MSWLIEAFLDEGKQGPDHPESLEMKNKKDFLNKKSEEFKNQTWYGGPSQEQIRRHNAAIDADKAEENNTKNKHDRTKATNALRKTSANGRDQNLHRHNALSAGDAVMRHNRRHPDRAVGESVDMLVEIMQ